MLKDLYANALAIIIINCVVEGKIRITWGTRQGYPLSQNVFALFIEPSTIPIRRDDSISPRLHGIAKLKLYTDDLVVYLKAEKSNIHNLLNKIKEFSLIWGMYLWKTVILLFNASTLDLGYEYNCLHPIRFWTSILHLFMRICISLIYPTEVQHELVANTYFVSR